MTKDAARQGIQSAQHSGLQPGLARAWETSRGIPGKLLDDVKNIRQFDAAHPIAQFQREAHLHPFTLLGERGAGAEARALSHIHPGLLAQPQVQSQLTALYAKSAAFVGTWVAGDALLTGDTLDLINPDRSASQVLELTGAAPKPVGGTP